MVATRGFLHRFAEAAVLGYKLMHRGYALGAIDVDDKKFRDGAVAAAKFAFGFLLRNAAISSQEVKVLREL